MASILLLEGDPDVRRLLLIVLADLGHAATAFETNADDQRGADLLILDPVSPSHLELARREREQNPGLPVICTSFVRERAFPGTGPVVHLEKPFVADDLRAAIEAALT
jgi:DNA-binding response OmpR family regulator